MSDNNTRSMKSVHGSVRAVQDHVIVSGMNFGDRRLKSGLIIYNDNAILTGIRARWAKVYSVGAKQTDVVVGQYVLIAHGRWTRGVDVVQENGDVVTIRRVDAEDILLITDTQPEEEYVAQGKWF